MNIVWGRPPVRLWRKGLNGRLVKIVLLFCVVFTYFSCNENGVDIVPTTQLKVEDVSVTEVWLRVIMSDTGNEIPIRQNDSLLTTLHPPFDTVLYYDDLLPKHTYTYKAGKGTTLAVTTMDTTSHNFTFEIDTLGDGQNSILRDVAIVNDTSVYVVGEMYIHDSTGTWDENMYNIAHWNGRTWKLSTGSSVGFQAVFAFSDTDIWAGTTAPSHWDGVRWKGYNVQGLFDGWISKIWGTSSTNVYMVGTNGSVMHFDGIAWSKMESGTDVDLLDIYGTPDGSNVWACGWVDFKPTVLLRLQNNEWQTVYQDPFPFTLRDDSLSGILSSVWTPNNKRLYLASGYGLYKCPVNRIGFGKRLSFTPDFLPGFPNRLRGNNENDMVVVGYYTMIAHYNGYTFRYFDELRYDNIHFYSVAQHNNIIVAIGEISDQINGKGIVYIGKR